MNSSVNRMKEPFQVIDMVADKNNVYPFLPVFDNTAVGFIQQKINLFINANYSGLGGVAAMNISVNKRTGYYTCIVKCNNGNTIILILSADTRLVDMRFVDVNWNTIEERNRYIVDLLKFGYTQVQTAIIVGVCQATVCAVNKR